MKKDWTYKKLREVGTVITGSTPSTKDNMNYSSQDVCFFKPSDLSSDSLVKLSKSEFYISKHAFEHSRKLPKGSVLTTCIGIIGKVGILTEEATCNQQINAIIPNPDIIISDFLGYSIMSKKHILQASANAPVVPLLNKTQFSEFSIPIPPLSIQRSIVAELDLLHSVISKKKEQLRELDNLAQSLFYQMFGDPITNPMGWEIKKLGEVAETTSGGTPSKSNNEYYENGTIPWLRSGEVSQGFIYNTELFITQKGLDNSSAKMIPVDSVAIAMYGATVGEVGIIKSPMCTNQAICSILPNKYLVPIYLRYFLMAMKPKYIAVAAGGAQPNISQAIIRNTHLPLPPLSLQQSFAAKVSAIEAQKQAITQSIQHTEALLAQRMDQYFG